MVRLLLVAAALGGAASADQKEKLRRCETVSLSKARVVRGELRAGGDRGLGWKLRKTAKGTLIYLAEERDDAAAERAGWYLSYDPKGKDARVGLSRRPGPGCYWAWSEGSWVKNRGGFGYTFRCTARPSEGPMRGWSSTADGGRLVLKRGPGRRPSSAPSTT